MIFNNATVPTAPKQITLNTALDDVTEGDNLIPIGATIKSKSFKPSTAYDDSATWELHLNAASDGSGADIATLCTFSAAGCAQTAQPEVNFDDYEVTTAGYLKMIKTGTPTVGVGRLNVIVVDASV